MRTPTSILQEKARASNACCTKTVEANSNPLEQIHSSIGVEHSINQTDRRSEPQKRRKLSEKEMKI